MLPDPFIATHHPSTARLDPSQLTAWIQLTNTRTDYNSPAHGSRSDQHYDTFTAIARCSVDNITVSNEAYINTNTMNDNEYDNDAMLTREYQRESREREYIRLDARTMVLSTIDELNQYLLGNVTLEAATDAARELTHKLNASW